MKKMYNIWQGLSLLLFLFFMQGCSSDPDDEKDVLELDVPELIFTHTDGPKTVELTSNTKWMGVPDETWCVVEPVMGKGNATVSITCSPNTDPQERNATIKFVTESKLLMREVKIKQLGTAPAIVVSPKTKEVSKDGEYLDVEITANVEFDLIFPDAWIVEAVVSRSEEKTTKTLEILPNEESDERKGEVIFKQKNGTVADTLRIVQPGQGLFIRVDQEERNIDAGETEFAVQIQTNVEFETIIQGGWITEKVVTRSSGTGIVKSFVAEENTGSQERSARIIFKQQGQVLADTVVVNQRGKVDLSGKNLVKSLLAVTEQGVPLEKPYRDELHLNYDSQNRLTWVKILKDEIDGDKVYVNETYMSVQYNQNNDVERIDQYDADHVISTSKELVSNNNNVLKYKLVYYGGSDGSIDHVEIKLNNQKQVTEFSGDGFGYKYTYDDTGTLTKHEFLQNDVALGSFLYQYEDKPGMFSTVGQPNYVWWLIPENEKPIWYIKNNVKSVTVSGDGATYSFTMNYEYNANNFPVKAAIAVAGRKMYYAASYY